MNDAVNHPKHYNGHPSGVECIDLAEQMCFNLGNAFKYVWRSPNKGGIVDLRMAEWYLAREVQCLEGMTTFRRIVPSPLIAAVMASESEARGDALAAIWMANQSRTQRTAQAALECVRDLIEIETKVATF